jgi:uncharacterized RDD family membrane protein YckC
MVGRLRRDHTIKNFQYLSCSLRRMQYNPYASWRRRATASLIDQSILLAPFGLALLFSEDIAVAVVWAGVAFWAWSMFFRQGRKGQSLGRSVTNTRLVDAWSGKPVGFWRAFVRNGVHVLDMLPLCIGFLWPLRDDRRQTWADKIMSTVVVDARSHETAPEPQPPTTPTPAQFTTLTPVA